MRTSEQIIREANEKGLPLSHVQAELRAGYEQEQIRFDDAIAALALMIEESVRLFCHIIGDVMKGLGAEVNAEGMANAYIESLRVSQDAFFYDVQAARQRPQGNVDDDGYEYEATLVDDEDGEEE